MPRGGFRTGAGRKPGEAGPKGQPIAVRLSPDLLQALEQQCRQTGVSRSELIERLLRRALAQGPDTES